MLTTERVLGRTWRYSVTKTKDHTEHKATFEVLKVELDGKLGIFISSKSTTRHETHGGIDLSDLDELTLEKLDELIQKKFVRELKDEPKAEADENNSFLSIATFVGANIIFWVGLNVLIPGLHANAQGHQKPWEVAIGAAMMIGGVVAIALRRG